MIVFLLEKKLKVSLCYPQKHIMTFEELMKYFLDITGCINNTGEDFI